MNGTAEDFSTLYQRPGDGAKRWDLLEKMGRKFSDILMLIHVKNLRFFLEVQNVQNGPVSFQ